MCWRESRRRNDQICSLTSPLRSAFVPTAIVHEPLCRLSRRRCTRHRQRARPRHESAGGRTVCRAITGVSRARQCGRRHAFLRRSARRRSRVPRQVPAPHQCGYDRRARDRDGGHPKITWGAPQPGDWLTYNGNKSANRYSPLKQITTANVSALKLKWVFPIPYFGLEVTPLAADGVLYVTGPNQVFALDALTGEALWHYSRPASTGMVGDARLGGSQDRRQTSHGYGHDPSSRARRRLRGVGPAG